VLIYYTEDGSKICARPSGTEPKIKFISKCRTDSVENFTEVESILNEKIKNIIIAMQLELNEWTKIYKTSSPPIQVTYGM
jgi:phosphomannomutase